LRNSSNQLLTLSTSHPILIYDGECIFCIKSVHFVLKHDKKNLFRYTTREKFIQEYFQETNLDKKELPDSVILLYKGEVYFYSDVVSLVVKLLDFKILYYSLKVVPSFIQNFFYRIIAKYRKKLFQRKDSCDIQNEKILKYFI
jgi:predicted DCC family thiol-disulfide oxidoreductase YuxK